MSIRQDTAVSKKVITIPQTTINREGGIVILPLREYRKLCNQTVPVYYLQNKKADKLDILIKEGLTAYHRGKCKKIKSLSDLG